MLLCLLIVHPIRVVLARSQLQIFQMLYGEYLSIDGLEYLVALLRKLIDI